MTGTLMGPPSGMVDGFIERASQRAILSADGLYRYWLTRDLGGSHNPCVFIMLNPSTADAEQDDPTIRRCMGFAKREGCGLLVVVNLFAYRTPSPKTMYHAHACKLDIVGPWNDAAIVAAARLARDGGRLIAAWGNQKQAVVGLRERTVLGLLKGEPMLRLHRAGVAMPYPPHPLYIPGDAALVVH